MKCRRNEELVYQGSDVDGNARSVSPLSRQCGQVPAHGDSMGRGGATEQVRWKSYMNSEVFYGYVFKCNGRTKPECYMYRVFGLPAGRREFIEKIMPGMELFLFDYDVKYLYGVYEATTGGRLNWEATAFGGKFPAQPEHTGYGYAAKIGYNIPAVQLQENSAQYQTSYSVQAGHPYLPEVPKSYERYEGAAQAMVPTHQYTDWRYEYNQLLPQTQMQMQENAAQHQSL